MYKSIRTTHALISFALLAVAAAPSFAQAEEEKPTAEFAAGVYSQYIWRGWAFSKDSMVIQPSMTVGYKGFAANIWGNLDTNQYDAAGSDEPSNFNETDLTLSYDGTVDKLGYGIGYIYYGLDSMDDSQEVYASVSYETLLSPTLKIYKEITALKGWYANLGISHSVALGKDISLDLGASVGYYDDEDTYNELHDGLISASVTFPLGEYASISPELYYSFGLSSNSQDRLKADNLAAINEEEDSFIYGGVKFAFSF